MSQKITITSNIMHDTTDKHRRSSSLQQEIEIQQKEEFSQDINLRQQINGRKLFSEINFGNLRQQSKILIKGVPVQSESVKNNYKTGSHHDQLIDQLSPDGQLRSLAMLEKDSFFTPQGNGVFMQLQNLKSQQKGKRQPEEKKSSQQIQIDLKNLKNYPKNLSEKNAQENQTIQKIKKMRMQMQKRQEKMKQERKKQQQKVTSPTKQREEKANKSCERADKSTEKKSQLKKQSSISSHQGNKQKEKNKNTLLNMNQNTIQRIRDTMNQLSSKNQSKSPEPEKKQLQQQNVEQIYKNKQIRQNINQNLVNLKEKIASIKLKNQKQTKIIKKPKQDEQIKKKIQKKTLNKLLDDNLKEQETIQTYNLQEQFHLFSKFDQVIQNVISKQQDNISRDVSPEKYENINLLNHLATMIQKVWKGFKTRKLIKQSKINSQYYDMWLKQQPKKNHRFSVESSQKITPIKMQQASLSGLLYEKSMQETFEEVTFQFQQIQQIKYDYANRLNNIKEKIIDLDDPKQIINIIQKELSLALEALEIDKQKQKKNHSNQSSNKKPFLSIDIENINQEFQQNYENKVNEQKERVLSGDDLQESKQQFSFSQVAVTENMAKNLTMAHSNSSNTPNSRKIVQIKDDLLAQTNNYEKNPFDEFTDNYCQKIEGKKHEMLINIPTQQEEKEKELILKPKSLNDKWATPLTPTKSPKLRTYPDFPIELQEKQSDERLQKSAQDLSCKEYIHQNDIQVSLKQIQNYKLDTQIVNPEDIDLLSENLLSFYLQEFTEEKINGKVQYQDFNPGYDTITDYLDSLSQDIMQHDLQEFLEMINMSKDEDLKSKLKTLQKAIFNKNFYFENKSAAILTEKQFYKREIEQKNSLLVTYHNKMLFDSFCEALEYFRPFDIRGKCLDWKINDKKLTFQTINESNIQIVFEQARHKIVEFSTYFTGFLNEQRPFSPPVIQSIYLPQLQFEKIERIIQDDVKRLNQIYEQNEVWNDYHNEETVIQLELSKQIQDQLVEELLKELNLLSQTQNQQS